MKKINLFIIIIFSTATSIFNMLYYSNNVNKANYYEENKSRKHEVIDYKIDYIPKLAMTDDNQSKMVQKVDEEPSALKENLEKEDLAKNELSSEEKSNDNSNANLEGGDSVEKFDYNTKQQEQSVFKVSTGKIEENLTTSDKIKLLYVSFQLGKENYRKVEEYLYAVDAEAGVLEALKLLEENLSKKEYEKVRKIAEKFIDMDAAERLK